MNAQTRQPPIQRPAAPLPRRVKRVGDEILRMAKRQHGVGLDEVLKLSPMKEQTARSRISKLKKKGYDIYRSPDDDRYYLIPPAPRSNRAEMPPVDEEASDVDEAENEQPSQAVVVREPAPSPRSTPDQQRNIRRMLEIMGAHRELHVVNFQGRLVFSYWNEHGILQMEHIDMDVDLALGAL